MDAKGASADERIAMLAARQHGVVAFSQLDEAGVSRTAVRRRVEARRLHRLYRGVYAVGHAAPSQHGRWMAAVLACRRAKGAVGKGNPLDSGAPVTTLEHWGAALSHRSAAEHWGLLSPRGGAIDVTVPGHGGKKRHRGIRMHRSRLLVPAAVTSRNGIPVTKPAKTIADLRRASTGRRPLIAQPALRRAIRQANFLGLPIDEEARRERTRSDLELDFLAFCRRFRLPQPEVNVWVGPHLVDFYWRRQKLVVETDGYAAHRGRAAFEDDRRRDLDLRARGRRVIRIDETQLDEEPHQVAEVVGAALRVGADGE